MALFSSGNGVWLEGGGGEVGYDTGIKLLLVAKDVIMESIPCQSPQECFPLSCLPNLLLRISNFPKPVPPIQSSPIH